MAEVITLAEPDPRQYFERKVTVAEPDPLDDHITKVTMECGHQIHIICYTPCSMMPCSQCVNDFVDQYRKPKVHRGCPD